MQVFKFGGASVKDADGVRNVRSILGEYSQQRLVVVVSAMGKTTNALEEVILAWFSGKEAHAETMLREVVKTHTTLVGQLITDPYAVGMLLKKIEELMSPVFLRLKTRASSDFNYEYDQLVGYGELLSTTIIAGYLQFAGLSCEWKDVRESIRTDESFREGRILWKETEIYALRNFTFTDKEVFITQGFLGSTAKNHTTTLGREGSDYTAAILANVLNAESVTIWKDVPGVMNADPRMFPDAQKIDQLSYADAIELTYYGTSVIHPRTIQPLQNKYIQLYVKSFIDPGAPGTVVGNYLYDKLMPVIIVKKDQLLFKIATLDFSFVDEEHLTEIFKAFSAPGLRINFMQNTALHFQICTNNDPTRVKPVIDSLSGRYTINLTEGLELVTLRYYDTSTIDKVTRGRKIVLEQRNEVNLQVVLQ